MMPYRHTTAALANSVESRTLTTCANGAAGRAESSRHSAIVGPRLSAAASSSVKALIEIALAVTSVAGRIGLCPSTSFSLLLKSTSEASPIAAVPTTKSVIACTENEPRKTSFVSANMAARARPRSV